MSNKVAGEADMNVTVNWYWEDNVVEAIARFHQRPATSRARSPEGPGIAPAEGIRLAEQLVGQRLDDELLDHRAGNLAVDAIPILCLLVPPRLVAWMHL
jgi:hypothetical protein